jgi:hypothetical protein
MGSLSLLSMVMYVFFNSKIYIYLKILFYLVYSATLALNIIAALSYFS